ncbi:MAG: nuclear transport factor 2 family protein [Pseudomonadota bacterium]
MDDEIDTLRHLYDRFNAQDIDEIMTFLTDDVIWANAMDGGHVHGHGAVRAYWTRQWTMVRAHVEPVGFRADEGGAVVAEVRQTVRDPEGRPLENQDHGLADRTILHVFRFRDGKISRFDARETEAG